MPYHTTPYHTIPYHTTSESEVLPRRGPRAQGTPPGFFGQAGRSSHRRPPPVGGGHKTTASPGKGKGQELGQGGRWKGRGTVVAGQRGGGGGRSPLLRRSNGVNDLQERVRGVGGEDQGGGVGRGVCSCACALGGRGVGALCRRVSPGGRPRQVRGRGWAKSAVEPGALPVAGGPRTVMGPAPRSAGTNPAEHHPRGRILVEAALSPHRPFSSTPSPSLKTTAPTRRTLPVTGRLPPMRREDPPPTARVPRLDARAPLQEQVRGR